MEVFRTLPPANSRPACGLAIGNFDGVHLGHQAIVRQLAQAGPGLPTMIMTFEPHPREFFAARLGGEPPLRISTEYDKLEALAQCGVDYAFVASFDEQMAAMPALAFITNIIGERLNARHLLVGDDFRFGAQRTGDYNMLTGAAANGAFTLHRMQTLSLDGQRVSSSLVRDALQQADFDRAAQLLGRPYQISGPVAHGRKLGRTLGFPTLNVELPFARPALAGIFVVQVHGLDNKPLPGVASLGTRPAVEAQGRHLLEVHLFDFARDVYGEKVRVQFLRKLRDEAHYDTLEKLTAQIAIDSQQARAFFDQAG